MTSTVRVPYYEYSYSYKSQLATRVQYPLTVRIISIIVIIRRIVVISSNLNTYCTRILIISLIYCRILC